MNPTSLSNEPAVNLGVNGIGESLDRAFTRSENLQAGTEIPSGDGSIS